MLDHNHQISIPKMIKWIWNVQILRVWELAVAARFEEGALSLSARADFVFFGTHMAGPSHALNKTLFHNKQQWL